MIDTQTHTIPYTPEIPDVAAYLYVPQYRGCVPKRMHELDEAARRCLSGDTEPKPETPSETAARVRRDGRVSARELVQMPDENLEAAVEVLKERSRR